MTGDTERAPRILAVDDLEENTRILERFLEPKGYTVFSVSSGKEALEFVEATPPDVILLDLVMPGISGFEVCERLKQSAETRHIPVIIITGLAEKEANVRALEAGADDFLPKPFDAILLSARIRSSLRSKKLQDQIIDYQRQLEGYNETLEERIKQRTAQVTRTQQVAVFSLAKLAESRDTETGAHLERMRSYAREVALEMANTPKYAGLLTADTVDGLFLSSPLHDIGKVGIPDQILLKPARLTSDEFEIMKTHTTIGGDTLKAADLEAGQASFLAMARDIAYYHHERWDGTGYPEGLKGSDIPLAARIVSIGDVYDALATDRPYKEAFSHEKSVSIIVEGRGTQFDPDVVDAFLACEQRIIEVRSTFHGADELAPIQATVAALEKLRARENAT